ncbi:glycoside hydrolase family 98 domain-containing protein [Pinibacter aurantiacus]|uniref:Carbohydrate-binding protein n=1 Tax=Pinibacter aurantiacus TaxID=2851599 RepID=A0A9E2SCE6_9BACT|nr:glycoside hydrolase family 98 domain-containing protein [Pinibacter aurantiacus]MBV4358747.1 carbohydrate-binding protein [Pinibacter aurantiacus]
MQKRFAPSGRMIPGIHSFIPVFLCVLMLQLAANAQSLRRPISPSSPMWLIHIDSWNYADPQKIIDLVPPDIRPYVVMNISLSINHDVSTGQFKVAEYGYETAKSWLRVCAQNRMWAMIQPASGGMTQFTDTALSVYEEFFKNYPNFLGFNYAEQFWGFDDASDPVSTPWTTRVQHFADLLNLSHKYGGYLVVSWCGNQYSPSINPIGMLKRSANFATASQQYAQNFILCEKYTTRSYKNDMESLCLGAYLSGFSGQYGIRYDNTGWTDSTNNNQNFTLASGIAPHLEHLMLTGQTVIDGPEIIWQNCFKENNRTATTDGYSMRSWSTFAHFDNIMTDIFRKVLDGSVRIPSRQEVINRTKLVVVQNVSTGGNDDIYSSPEHLFEGLYRMDSDGNYANNYSFFKKTGRYPTIPTVYQLGDALANTFSVVVNKSDYATRWPTIASKQTEFNNLFPSEYTGDIYAGRHENGWLVYNPYKNNKVATGNIPFKYNTCSSIGLSLSQYTAGVIKETASQLKIYLNNYQDEFNTGLKTDVITINGSTAQPSYSYTDRANHTASVLSASWSGGIYTLTVNHNGPVDITINCAGSGTGRLTSFTTATLSAPSMPAVYLGTRQYEAEMFDYKNIVGLVTSGASGNIRNYTGQGYLSFGTSSTAAVRDTVSVESAGSYQLGIRYTVTGGDVGTIGLFVNGSQVATPDFTATSTLNNWDTLTQNVTLNQGTNVIELKALSSAPQQLYIDNFMLSPGNAGNDVWMEAECGTVGSLFTSPQDATASAGRYITVQAGNNSTANPPSTADGQITYDFNISTAGTYNLWARVRAFGPNDDSFWIKMDNGNWTAWNNMDTATVWAWENFQSYYLSAGNHTLTLGYREDGTHMDKIYIGTGLPVDNGGNAVNCYAVSTLQENETGFCGVDGTIDTNYSGYTGTGFANTNNFTGAGVNWKINFASSGTKTFTVRYASTNTRPAKLIVNGVAVVTNISFTSTGSWTTWNTIDINAAVTSGSNTVRLEGTTADGLPNIDNLQFSGGTPASCTVSGAAVSDTKIVLVNDQPASNKSVVVYPNPAQDNITVKLGNYWKKGDMLFIYDNAGVPRISNHVIKQNEELLDISRLPAGLYVISIMNREGAREILKFVKIR